MFTGLLLRAVAVTGVALLLLAFVGAAVLESVIES
jgi:hypothetical protein